MTQLPQHIQDRIHLNTETGCWEWTGTLLNNGYGVISWEGRHVVAHRLLLRLVGRPVPDGEQTDHRCRVRKCVNPEHLEAVSASVNARRRQGGNVEKTHCPQGHEYTPDNIGWITTTLIDGTKGSGRQCKACNRAKTAARRARLRADSL